MEAAIVTRPMQWAAIPDISAVPPLSDKDADCFRELRDVLARHNCLDRFGINLIHSHFPLAEDEVLVEDVDAANRTLTVRPMKKGIVPPSVETQWQLSTGDAVQICHGYCITNVSHQRHHTPV